jgi:8-oxo-dGTP diphosphatase
MQNTSARSYTALVKDKLVTFTHLGSQSIPPFHQVTSVSVIPFTKSGDIVAVRLRHRGLDIPGGHVESGEKIPQATLEREAMEEACISITNPVLTEVVESDFFDERPSFMLVYTAFVNKLYPFQTPDNEMSDERLIVTPKKFIEQYQGNKQLMTEAIATAWAQLLKNR